MYVTDYIDNTKYKQSTVMYYADYLEKERLIQEKLEGATSRQLAAYLDKQNDVVRVEGQEYFFNGSGNTFDCEDVTEAIDANVKGLKKTEARYYTFSVSPSMPEIAHLRRTIADGRAALFEAGEVVPENFDEDMMRSYLKEYTVRCMDAYARNFGHPKVRDNRDLLWFGMVEKDRYWKSHDKEVRANAKIDKRIEELRQLGGDAAARQKIAALEKRYVREYRVREGGSREILRAMMPKSGDNWHVHICVSRRDRTNSFNLSPNANGRGSKKHVLNGKAVRVGFDRERYKIGCEELFDRMFIHSRLQTESYKQAKLLRRKSLYAFERQRALDRAGRRAEAREFARLRVDGYRAYYQNLLQAEKIDARQLMRLKGYLARQVHTLAPQRTIEELMNYDLEELQHELAQFAPEQNPDLTTFTEGVAVNIGDRAIEVAGLHGYRPIRRTHKLLRHGIRMCQAVDRRRDMFDKWYEIYSDAWARENYAFQSISSLRDADCLLSQAEFLENELGESVLLANAVSHAASMERNLVKEFLAEKWPSCRQDTVNRFATELFGKEAAAIRMPEDFGTMARERLLPLEAQRQIDLLAVRCEQPQDLIALRKRIAALEPMRAAARGEQLEKFIGEKGQLWERLQALLKDDTLSVHAKEEALLRLCLEDKAFGNAVRDIRSGALKVLEKRYPDMKNDRLRKMLGRLSENTKDIGMTRQAEIAEKLEAYLKTELPGYRLVVEKQSQMEQLIREITPDAKACSERIVEANRDVAEMLSPHTERLFEQQGRRLFGKDVCLKNEHDFTAYVEGRFPAEQARKYEASLRSVYTRIEDCRRSLIQQYVDRKIAEKVWNAEPVRRRQHYINRYIGRKFSAMAAKTRKEALQQRVAGICRRPVLPSPQYKVFDHAVRQLVAARAMVHARSISIASVTPQQLALKAAFKAASKIIGILTKGY